MAGSMFCTDKKEITRISKAILNNDMVELKSALADGEDPHFKDRKQNTYLHYVCTMHRPFLIHIIIGTGVDLNAKNRHGNTALHVTALQNECCHVGDLMAAGVDPNIRNNNGLTAAEIPKKNEFWKTIYDKYQPGIFEAIDQHDIDKVTYLLHCWSRVDTTRDGQTLRQYAACRKHHDIVRIIDTYRHSLGAIYSILEANAESASGFLNHAKCDVNLVNYAAKNAHILQYAIKLRDLRLIRMICRANVDVSVPVTVQCYLKAPLFFEVLNASIPEKIMWAVLKAGPDFTKKDERGRNAAIFALDKTNRKVPMEVIAYMLKNGLDVSQRDVTGVTLRDVARFARRRDILTLLDKAYVNLIRTSNIEELDRLCMMGYDSMLINFNYRDSFIYASGNETEEVVEFIQWLPKFMFQVRKFRFGIRQWSLDNIIQFLNSVDRPDLMINARDKGGRAPIHLCVLHWRFDILKFLLAHEKINVNACDNLGRSAYHYACAVEEEDERKQFCSLLIQAGIDTELNDNRVHAVLVLVFFTKAEENVGSSKAAVWLNKERKTYYGMVKQVACVDKYEELVHLMKYKGKNLKHFNRAVCRFKYPVPKFSHILAPVMPDYRDLIFIAMEKGKEDIAIKLIQLGTDWRRREMCSIVDPDSETEQKEQFLSVAQRAEQLGMHGILAAIESKKQYLHNNRLEEFQQEKQDSLKKISSRQGGIRKIRRSFDSQNDQDGRQTPSVDENGDVPFEEEVIDSSDEDSDDEIDEGKKSKRNDNDKKDSDFVNDDVDAMDDSVEGYSDDSFSVYEEDSDGYELPE